MRPRRQDADAIHVARLYALQRSAGNQATVAALRAHADAGIPRPREGSAMTHGRSEVARSVPERREALAVREPAGAPAPLGRVLARHGVAASTAPVVRRGKLARSPGPDVDFAEVDETAEIDDEAAEYLYDPTRNPNTLGLYLLPALTAAETKAKQAAETKLKEAAEAKAKLEAEVKAKEVAEAKAKEAAEAQARLEEEAKQAAEAKAKEEAEAKATEAAEAKAKLEAEAKAKEVAEAQARAEAEAKAKAAAEAKAKQAAEAQARLEEEAKQAAEAKAKEEAEAKAKAAAEAKAKLEAEAKAKAEAEAKAKAEAEAKAKQAAAAKAKVEAEAKAAQEALAKKAEIREELRKRLVDPVKGGVVDQWAKLTADQQAGFVLQVFEKKATQAAYQTAKQSAAELAKAAIRAEKEADLQADKIWLKRGVDALGASAEITEMFKAAIDLHKKSDDSYGLTVQKAYPENTIVAACGQWGLLENTEVIDPTAAIPGTRVRVRDKLKIVSNLHSPGWQATTVDWKQRGKHDERTRNLIAVVDGLKSNVHVHPPGGWQKKH